MRKLGHCNLDLCVTFQLCEVGEKNIGLKICQTLFLVLLLELTLKQEAFDNSFYVQRHLLFIVCVQLCMIFHSAENNNLFEK